MNDIAAIKAERERRLSLIKCYLRESDNNCSNVNCENASPLCKIERESAVEEITEIYNAVGGIPLDELETLCEAWRDGRVVVLPVKIGDTIHITHGKTEEERKINICELETTGFLTYVMGKSSEWKHSFPICLTKDFGKTAFTSAADALKGATDGSKS